MFRMPIVPFRPPTTMPARPPAPPMTVRPPSNPSQPPPPPAAPPPKPNTNPAHNANNDAPNPTTSGSIGASNKPPGFLSGMAQSTAATVAATVGGGWILNAFTGKDTTGLGSLASGIGSAVGGIGEGLGDVASGAGSALAYLPMAAIAGGAIFLFMEMRKK